MTKDLHPEPGTYQLRLVKGGPWVPLLIWSPCPWVHPGMEVPVWEWCRPSDRADRRLVALLRGEWISRQRLDALWGGARPISWARYNYLTALAGWVDAWAPDQPEARPREPIDLRTHRPLF